ncbi:MAG: glutathione S-transferase family protein [Pseudomonadota bacterium]
MITIYHTPGTRSVRVIWLCEELSIPYEVVTIDFSAKYRSSPEWRKMNPTGKVPVMTDGDLKIFESGAMVQYILDCYGNGQLQPKPGTHEHAEYLQWSWFAESTYARPLGEIVNHRRELAPEDQSTVAIEEMQKRAWTCAEALETSLAGRNYLLGDEFSAADIMMGYSIMLTELLVKREFPENLAGYWARISSRSGYLTATKDIA